MYEIRKIIQMGLFGFGNSSKKDKWIPLQTLEELDLINEKSNTKPQVIFKHSTRCSISMMAKSRMEGGLEKLMEDADVYYLDLIANRAISDEIASRWQVPHESPQVIVIRNGKAEYVETHHMIRPEEIRM